MSIKNAFQSEALIFLSIDIESSLMNTKQMKIVGNDDNLNLKARARALKTTSKWRNFHVDCYGKCTAICILIASPPSPFVAMLTSQSILFTCEHKKRF